MIYFVLLSLLFGHPTYAEEETTPTEESSVSQESTDAPKADSEEEKSSIESSDEKTADDEKAADSTKYADHADVLDKAQRAKNKAKLFNSYILRAVNYLNKNYPLLGYNLDAAYTHKIEFGKKGEILPSNNGQTMCVAAVLETILTAFQIYYRETGDVKVWDYLPIESWKQLQNGSIRAYIWVDEIKLKSFGTADALSHFGMGERVPYDELTPGTFANINFADGGGHAVVFLNWVDADGEEIPDYDAKKVAGMRFFSAQGEEEKGKGGLGFGYAFFNDRSCKAKKFTKPVFCGMIRSDQFKYMNTGRMFMPQYWKMPENLPKKAPVKTAERGKDSKEQK